MFVVIHWYYAVCDVYGPFETRKEAEDWVIAVDDDQFHMNADDFSIHELKGV